MHLLQTIIPFYITLSLTFSTALAMPAAGKKPTPTPTAVSCPQTPKTFSSLPCNISLEFPVPRDIPSGGFDLYSLRLKYYSAFSATGWDYAKIEREENVGNVFQLKDKKLIPLGGSTPASLLRTSFTGGFASGDLRPIVFNPDFDYESTELDFVATRECDDKGKQFLRLRADNGEWLYIVLSCVGACCYYVNELMTTYL